MEQFETEVRSSKITQAKNGKSLDDMKAALDDMKKDQDEFKQDVFRLLQAVAPKPQPEPNQLPYWASPDWPPRD